MCVYNVHVHNVSIYMYERILCAWYAQLTPPTSSAPSSFIRPSASLNIATSSLSGGSAHSTRVSFSSSSDHLGLNMGFFGGSVWGGEGGESGDLGERMKG